MELITFQPVFPWVVLAIVFAAALLMLLIGPSFIELNRSRRITLTGLRLGVILLVFLAMLRPGCVEKIEKNQAAILLFLLDSSRSMELPHVADDSSRWKAMVEMVRENEGRIAKLAENKIETKFYTFDNRQQLLDVEGGVVNLPEKPEGAETDIGSALYRTSIDARDQRLLAVVMATDGNQNTLEPEVEISQAAEALEDMEVPLLAVQLGLAGDSGQLADVAITNFPEQLVVNKKNDLIAKATMVTRGYVNQNVKVQLVVSDENGVEQTVATEVFRPSKPFEETNIELKYRPAEPGEFRIKVRAVPMPDEKAVRNNELDGFLTVRDQGMRVLFVNGALGNEQRFLRYSLPALDFVDMDFVPIYPSENARRQWPLKTLEAEFRDPKKYDVFILCNVDSTALSSASWDALAEAVGAGKGLLMLGGTHSFGAGQYFQTALADLLPIKMDPRERQEFDQDIRRELHINSPFKLKPVRNDFLTRISDVESYKKAWEELPPLVGANRISVKETATVYLVSDDDANRPIMASATVGGRVLVFAGDSTWRWRRLGFEAEYNRFWRQVVLWLAFWDARSDEAVSIELPKRRFNAKSLVKFGVVVKSIAGEVVEDVDFDAKLVLPSGEEKLISITKSGDSFQSVLEPEMLAEAGLYQVRVAANRNGNPVGESTREFVVMDRDKEKANPVANPEQMKRLADQTRDFGGRAIPPEQLSKILDEYIDNPPMTKIEIPNRRRLGESMPDATIFIFVFVGLLGTEWWLRKKWGLV